MASYIWLFPLLFIFHDFEEIIGMRLWVARNGAYLSRRFPRFAFIFKIPNTEGFAIAVAEELILILIISILALTNNRTAQLLWIGAFIGFTAHLVVHIAQTIIIRKYIPALATSFAILPLCIWITITCIQSTEYSLIEILAYSLIAIITIGANLLLAHWIARKYGKWVDDKLKKC